MLIKNIKMAIRRNKNLWRKFFLKVSIVYEMIVNLINLLSQHNFLYYYINQFCKTILSILSWRRNIFQKKTGENIILAFIFIFVKAKKL